MNQFMNTEKLRYKQIYNLITLSELLARALAPPSERIA